MRTEGAGASGAKMDDLDRYRSASWALETTQSEIEELEQTEAFEVFQKQLGLLRRRLLNSPQSLRQMFIDDGMQAIVWEFKQDALGRNFTSTLWRLLLRDDDMSAVLLRFIWNVPLKFKRKFIAAIDAHLSDLPHVQGPVAGLARAERHSALHPFARGAGQGLRARQPGLHRLHEPRLQRA